MRIAVDAMGGDYAPGVVIEAVRDALRQMPDVEIVLVGHLEKLSYYLDKLGLTGHPRIRLVHAETVVEMGEPSTASIRAKRNSSITVCADLVKAGEADAIVSAGHTGAAVAATKVRVRTIPEVERPALATLMPSVQSCGKTVLVDVGANVECSPLNLVQFAVMGELYCQCQLGIEKPRVGLLSVGGEEHKGTDLTRCAFEVLSKMPINFVGNVEGYEIFCGGCDVIVCNGFVGNVVLKASEGLARATMFWLKEAVKKNVLRYTGAMLIKEAFVELKAHGDSDEYGGAPLVGLKSPCIIGHGASSPKAVMNAIRVSDKFLKFGFNDRLAARIRECGISSVDGKYLPLLENYGINAKKG